jgi:hypothetical protein
MKRYAAAKLAALMLSTRSVAEEIDHRRSGVGSSKSPMMGRLHSVSARPRPTLLAPAIAHRHSSAACPFASRLTALF